MSPIFPIIGMVRPFAHHRYTYYNNDDQYNYNIYCSMEIFLFAPAVSPQSQADSYKRMDDGKWVFGLDNLWVLAPTRHGAHNWEGPGKLTAMKALESLSLHTKANSFIESKADGKKVVIAGHSMGGHGAW